MSPRLRFRQFEKVFDRNERDPPLAEPEMNLGEGVFISREVVLYGASSRALELGHDLRKALLQGSLDEAADRLALETLDVLSGIGDDAKRQALRQKLARRLLGENHPSRGDSPTDRL